MNGTHPTAEQLDLYRRRAASPAETVDVDTHIAACDRCFDAVRADAHLTFDELAALADGRAGTDPHLILCARCRGEVDDLRQMREAVRAESAPRRSWLLPLAAVLAIAVVAALLLVRRDAPALPPPTTTTAVAETAPPPSTLLAPEAPPQKEVASLERPAILDTLVTERGVLRGTPAKGAFALVEPVATVVLETRPRFRWTALDHASSYEVAVVDLDRGAVVESGTSKTPSWRPAAPLPRGKTYAWQVTAETKDARVVAPGRGGAEARFHVAKQSSVAGVTSLERGIALANLGALNDAERELLRAGARELLNEIRSWR
jgi:hypothetical protein